MKLIYSSFSVLLFLHIAVARRSRQVSSGQERGGVGIQLPSLSLWPWRDNRQHRAATLSLKKQPVNYPQVSQRRQEAPDRRLHKAKSHAFYKKPTGLEKKQFGAKYPSKQQISKYQQYQKQKPPPQKNLRFAPVPDLRPTSIDRIDILRPQKIPQSKQPLPRPGAPLPQAPSKAPRTSLPITFKGPQRPRKPASPQPIPILSGIKIQEPTKPVRKYRYPPSSLNSIDTNAIIDFTESPVEVDGLKLFMFRGDEGFGTGFTPLASPIVRVSSAGSRGQYQPQAPQRPGPSPRPLQWSQAELRPASVTPVTTARPRGDIAPPFPTRHTTPSPHLSAHQPVVIIAQSNVAQNN